MTSDPIVRSGEATLVPEEPRARTIDPLSTAKLGGVDRIVTIRYGEGVQ